MSKTKKSKAWSRISLLALFYLLAGATHSQGIQAVSITLQTESISIPFTRITEWHPGVEIGFTLAEKEQKRALSKWNGYIGWFYHEDFDQSIYLRGEYELSWQIQQAIAFHLPLGIGYMHSFNPAPVYTQNSDGSFDRKTQLGRPHALLNTGIGASYLKMGNVQPFIKYEVFVQSPFVVTIPAGPRNFFKVGTTIKLN